MRSAVLRGNAPRRTGTRFCPRRNGDSSSSSSARMRASSGDSSYERDEVRGSATASKSSSGNVDDAFRAMKAVKMPTTAAIRLTISGFFGGAEMHFAPFAQTYLIRKHLCISEVAAEASLSRTLCDCLALAGCQPTHARTRTVNTTRKRVRRMSHNIWSCERKNQRAAPELRLRCNASTSGRSCCCRARTTTKLPRWLSAEPAPPVAATP